eukprot:11219948-Ditylum_brightwellii.AAC.1
MALLAGLRLEFGEIAEGALALILSVFQLCVSMWMPAAATSSGGHASNGELQLYVLCWCDVWDLFVLVVLSV